MLPVILVVILFIHSKDNIHYCSITGLRCCFVVHELSFNIQTTPRANFIGFEEVRKLSILLDHKFPLFSPFTVSSL